MSSSFNINRVTFAGLLVTIGIIFGDIGTSPLYVFKAIIGDKPIDPGMVLGGVSCIFWTLTLQTTVKYVIITLNADNKGEGGVFALFSLIRRGKSRWLLFPAIIGGSALLADGIITPPISISSAVEGLRYFDEDISHIPIVIVILTLIFSIQQFGTRIVGRSFGPMMVIWFSMLAILGISQIIHNPSVFRAINPTYAWTLLAEYPDGFWLLGAVFLCTTGAEALYSDLGHCGKANIRVSWTFVKTSLLLNYFGQAAWLVSNEGKTLDAFAGGNPFYSIMPSWFLVTGILIATCSAIIASQAVISGSFTMINEAMRLDFWPKVKVNFPSDLKGQLYIPSINWLLFAGCVGVVLYFRESSNMEAAYGLAIVLAMLSTTTLLSFYLLARRYNVFLVWLVIFSYLLIEISFLVANLYKFPHGGYITLMITGVIITLMWMMHKAKFIKATYVEFIRIKDYLPLLKSLSENESVPKYSTHLVYMTSAGNTEQVESKILYSILEKQPKRADFYWLVHVEFVDEPYRMDYAVTTLVPNDVIRIDFFLGFRIEPRINLMFRKVVEELIRSKEVNVKGRNALWGAKNDIGDFRFLVIQKILSHENELPPMHEVILKTSFYLKSLGLSEPSAFGLDLSSVTIEQTPLILAPATSVTLNRIYPERGTEAVPVAG